MTNKSIACQSEKRNPELICFVRYAVFLIFAEQSLNLAQNFRNFLHRLFRNANILAQNNAVEGVLS